jgi:hypothetical protein
MGIIEAVRKGKQFFSIEVVLDGFGNFFPQHDPGKIHQSMPQFDYVLQSVAKQVVFNFSFAQQVSTQI